ncbi:unnamed protein product [Caenorhabditis auriculariae]|uniref:Uncharacterized protein n=1 Tax=Caenorhabditis auriculariae TaxID=2777116 RepID=A0A8S1GQE3_9PELO|nr:unnamed protein product [Caenorhabditis auriculariae]
MEQRFGAKKERRPALPQAVEVYPGDGLPMFGRTRKPCAAGNYYLLSPSNCPIFSTKAASSLFILNFVTLCFYHIVG